MRGAHYFFSLKIKKVILFHKTFAQVFFPRKFSMHVNKAKMGVSVIFFLEKLGQN